MKKIILSAMCLIGFSVFLSPVFASAQSVFEISNLPETINAPLGQQTVTYVKFRYTGGVSKLAATVVGDLLPKGLSLSPVEYGVNGESSVKYAGIPTTLGVFPLQIVFTDENGHSVSKNFKVNVEGFSLLTTTLPPAVLNKKYSTKIAFTYPGTTAVPLMKIGDITQDSYLNFAFMGVNASDKAFTIEMTPRKVGKFSFKGTVTINGLEVATKVYTIQVVATDAEARKLQGTTPAKTQASSSNTSAKTNSGQPSLTDVPASSTSESLEHSGESPSEEASWFRKIVNFLMFWK